MGAPRFAIDPDIRRASLPPAELYGDPLWFEAVREQVFARSWEVLLPLLAADPESNAVPVDLAGEPLLWTRDGEGSERLLSNVCTHRGATVVDRPCRLRTLRCPYHGRRWALDGAFSAAPGFEGAIDFPAERDDLAPAHLGRLGPLRVGAVDPAMAREDWLEPVRSRVPWFDWEGLRHAPEGDREWTVEANWALYVDNYLEGFHVPYVHPGLARVLDPDDYRYEELPRGTVQLGFASDPADAFPLPADHPDHGVAGVYFWLFPTTMLNLYPWGMSLNAIQPLGPGRTRIVYRTFFSPGQDQPGGAGGALDAVELEDQAIVARAQRGLRARLYPGGRYAPAHEAGLHHFHRLLAAALG